MTRLMLQLLLFILLARQSATAQTIEGYWLSRDSSRRYEIKKHGDTYNCILKSSTRKADRDKCGAVVLRNISYNNRKKYYAGEIISLVDGSIAFTRIYIHKQNPGVLRFRIYHFLSFFAGTIYWVGCPE